MDASMTGIKNMMKAKVDSIETAGRVPVRKAWLSKSLPSHAWLQDRAPMSVPPRPLPRPRLPPGPGSPRLRTAESTFPELPTGVSGLRYR